MNFRVVYLQALVPSPVPLDQIPIPKQNSSKFKSPTETGDDTKINPPTTLNHEGVV